MNVLKYGLAVALLGCQSPLTQRLTDGVTKGAPRWQFIPARGNGQDAVFDPHTSVYCSFQPPKMERYCIVMAPDSLVARALSTAPYYVAGESSEALH